MEIVTYVQIAAWTAGTVSAAFLATDLAITDAFRRDFGKTLISFGVREWISLWPERVKRLFDNVFDEHHFTMRCILRSCIVSLFSITVIFVLFLILSKNTPAQWWIYWANVPVIHIFIGLVPPIIFNLVTDYFALLETRWVIYAMRGKGGKYRLVLFLVVDFVATIFVFIIVFGFISAYLKDGLLSYFGAGRNYGFGLSDFLYSYRDTIYLTLEYFRGFTIDPQDVRYFETPILFYSTFATSIWVWLSFLAVVSSRILNAIVKRTWSRWKVKFLDVEDKPFQSLAWSMRLLIIFVYIVCAPFVLSSGT